MKKTSWLLIAGLLIAATAILILRPVPISDEKSWISLKGTVVEVYEGGVKDVVFKLHGLSQTFYINRGLERGLYLKQLRSALINQEVTIRYPKYWTPLDPGNTIRHIAKLEYQGRTIFTELR